MRRTFGQSDEYEIAVVTEFFENKGLRVERIKHSGKQGKTPDLRLISDRGQVALCEVKAANDEPGERHFDGMSAGETRVLSKKDPTFNRIASHIEKAHGQLSAYDPEHHLLRFVAFVNYDDWSDSTDLGITLTGEIQTINGPISLMKGISEGRLGIIKHQIDSYLWFRAYDKFFEGGYLTHNQSRNTQTRHLLGFIS